MAGFSYAQLAKLKNVVAEAEAIPGEALTLGSVGRDKLAPGTAATPESVAVVQANLVAAEVRLDSSEERLDTLGTRLDTTDNRLGVAEVAVAQGASDVVELGALVRGTSERVVALEHAAPEFTLTGAVVPFASATPPGGWLVCDGALVSRADYPALSTALGTLYNRPTDPLDSFRLPDLRGEFIRGFDGGRGVDAARTLGSAQGAGIAPHKHGLPMNRAAIVDGTIGPTSGLNTAASFAGNVMIRVWDDKTSTSLNNTGTETRPRNVALLYCIKT